VAQEARYFKPPRSPRTEVLMTGMGSEAATLALERRLSQAPVKMVLSCGFAGGLNPDRPLGQVLCDDSKAGGFQARLESLDLAPARFVHSDRVLITAIEKAQLHQDSGADAVEMESSPMRDVCQQRDIPILVLRVISDTAADDLPMDFNRYVRPDGTMALGRLLMGVARSPSVLPRLVRFRRRVLQASESLGHELGRVLEALS
jgi:nucleoside phosphorylase